MITAIVQPLIDIIVSCSFDLLRSLDFLPGSYKAVTQSEQRELLEMLRSLPHSLAVGGSATNSLTTACSLGIPCRMVGLAGNDSLGQLMLNDLQERGIEVALPLASGATTGSCVSLVTPDGERTMRTHLGVSTALGPHDITLSVISGAQWLLLEGYLLTSGTANARSLHKAISIARHNGIKVALTAAATFVVDSQRDLLLNSLLDQCDLLFASAPEALRLTNSHSAEEALQKLKTYIPNSVITKGEAGACGSLCGVDWQIPVSPPPGPTIDTTGAGDTFAGAFL